MKIIIEKITINNFKGCKSRIVKFNQDITTITGANETGKSTIVDAFLWCLFGKNAMGKADFSIKNTKDTSLNKGDHSVEVVLVVNGENMTFKRTYKEIWGDSAGDGNVVLKGHTTDYKWNLSPIGTQKAYNEKVEQIINLEKFKLLTNPLYFNSLSWETMRSLVVELVNENEFDSTAFNNVIELTRNKSVKELKTQLAATKKENDKVLKEIPARIDEKIREKVEENPELPELIEKAKSKITSFEKVIQSEIESKKKQQEENLKIIQLKNKLTGEIAEIGNEYRIENYSITDQKNTDKRELESAEKDLKNWKEIIESNEKTIAEKQKSLDAHKKEWQEHNAKVFEINSDDCKCPTCERNFDSELLAEKETELRNKFNTNKALKLKEIIDSGNRVSESISKLKSEIEAKKVDIIAVEKVIKDLNEKKYDETKLNEIKSRGEVARKKLNDIIEPEKIKYSEEVDEAKKQIELLKTDIENYQKIQNQIENNAKIDKRILELETEQKQYAQLNADSTKIEKQIEKYENAKMNFLQKQINAKFKDVSFSMFNKKIDGELELTCTCLYKGVPFADANNGGKINCGLEIIDIFSKQNDTYLPIFVDNKESVDELFETNCQIINLVVNKNVKVLQIE